MSDIDPSTVKAGDTVTLEVGAPHPAKIEGVVQEVKEYHAFELKPLRFYIGGYLFSPYDYTLTAHQPAPEPEPEWKPGTVAVATVRGMTNVRVMRLEPSPTDTRHHWVDLDGTIPDDSRVTDVRPLVVIDPAAVDVDALVEVAHRDRVLYGDTTPDQMRRATLRVLAHMGIEATS